MIAVPTDPRLHIVFDAAAWLSGLAAGFMVYRWRLKAANPHTVRTPLYFIALAVGAIIGAYVTGTLAIAARGALSHSVLGALLGATLAVEAYKAARGIRGSTGAAFVVPFSLGLVIGRWGCLFAGLADGTYGIPADLPWTVDLGDGIPRHPVQLYESAAMALFLVVFLVALMRNATWPLRHGFHVMVIWYAAQRFLWEFLKPLPALVGPFNLFHLICLGLIAYGCIAIARNRQRPLPA